MEAEGRKRTGLVKRIVLFLFRDLWEGAYRRKRERALYGHDVLIPPYRRGYPTYYPRYHWITKKKRSSGGVDT